MVGQSETMEVVQLEEHTQNGAKMKPDILQTNTGCLLLNGSKEKEITVLGSQMRYGYYK